MGGGPGRARRRGRPITVLIAIVAAAGICLGAIVSACAMSGERAAAGGRTAGGSALPAIAFTTATGETILLAVEVADEPEGTGCGLMYRTSLPDDQGMIFAYTKDSAGAFWMRNTLIPLSIAFTSADGRIVDILDMEPVPAPGHTPVRMPDGSVVAVLDGQPIPVDALPVMYRPRTWFRYAVEANRGWFARHGIAIGDRVDPAITIGGSAGTPPALCRDRT